MKKVMIIALSIFVAGASFAQSKEGAEQIQNKKGIDMMPEKGDFGLGFNALPLIGYIGNFFGKDNNNFVSNGNWNKFNQFFGNNTIYGKYFLTDKSAVRFNLGLRTNNFTRTYDVFDDTQTNPDFKVEDKYKQKSTDITLGVGYEWRRGKNRFRAVYGAEVYYLFQTGVNQTYSYGNAFGAGNITPTSTFGSNGINGGIINGNVGERILSNKGGNLHGAGARVFVGVEYFIAPKISLATEFGYGIGFTTTGFSTRTVESWDVNAAEVSEEKFYTNGEKAFNVDTDNFSGALSIMFYF